MPNSDNGWERWRGEVDAKFRQTDSRLEDAEDSVKQLWEFKSEADKRVAIIETKLIVLAALSAALGAMLPGVVQAMFK